MSKIKQLTNIDDYDLGYFTLEPIMPEYDEPARSAWAMRDLESALDTLYAEKPYEYLTELEVASERLRMLIDDIKVPF